MTRALLVSFRVMLALCMFAAATTTAWAAWPTDPLVNVPICTSAGPQGKPTIAVDGAGGAIITWQDNLTGHVYAQHVSAGGTVDPAWPANGRVLCNAANDQQSPRIVPDGAGGAIVTWADRRSGTNYDIYAQHVLAGGAVDPAWPVDGRGLCTAALAQEYQTIAADGAGGAIVVWQDLRDGTDYDIYAQHVMASGAVDPAWPVDGQVICFAAKHQFVPVIVADGAGGAVIAWYDLRGANRDIYAQHVLANGAVDPNWTNDGVVLCGAAGDQDWPAIVADGAGGAVVAWEDHRGTNDDVYAQHVLAKGTVDPAWPTDGQVLCAAVDDQFNLVIAADGGGGAIVAWEDYRSGTNYDIYAQHVRPGGTVDPGWPGDGRAVSIAANDQQIPTLVADGTGGAIATWFDLRNGTDQDIYAQRVLASGATDPAWPADGRRLCAAAGDQEIPTIVADVSGGAIVTWQDSRSGNADIYAQRISSGGNLGGTSAAVAATLSCSTVGGVCSEQLNPVNGAGHPFVTVGANGFVNFKVDAGCGVSPCSGLCTLTPSGQPAGATWPATYGPIPGASSRAMGPFTVPGTYTYVMSCSPGISGTIDVSSAQASVPGAASLVLTLDAVRPNPASGPAQISFSLPATGAATIELYDVAGRLLRQWSWASLPAGRHEIQWDGTTADGRQAAPGVLLYRLRAGGQTVERRLVHLQ